jgi:hypothetical protein
MKTPTSVFVIGAFGCLSSALLSAGVPSHATAADSTTTLSLLQQSSLAAAVTKAQGSGTAPILPNPTALVLTAQKGRPAVGTLTLKKSSADQHTYYISTNQSWVWLNPPYGSTQSITSETDQLMITAQTANYADRHPFGSGVCGGLRSQQLHQHAADPGHPHRHKFTGHPPGTHEPHSGAPTGTNAYRPDTAPTTDSRGRTTSPGARHAADGRRQWDRHNPHGARAHGGQRGNGCGDPGFA